MNSIPLCLERWAAWAPGLETAAALAAWGRGEASIEKCAAVPALDFLPPLFRRRLSQLSKMVLEVGHRLTKSGQTMPCVFASHYGEINKQYAISKGLLETHEVSPAVFSLSVFNTPVYLLSIAEHNTAAGSAVYSGEYGLPATFLDALGFIRSGAGVDGGAECLAIFADEYLPPAYHRLFDSIPEPYAFGIVLSSRPLPGARALSLEITAADADLPPTHPLRFLRWLVTAATAPFSFHAPGMQFTLKGAGS